ERDADGQEADDGGQPEPAERRHHEQRGGEQQEHIGQFVVTHHSALPVVTMPCWSGAVSEATTILGRRSRCLLASIRRRPRRRPDLTSVKLETSDEAGRRTLSLHGRWTVEHVAALER